MRAVAMTVAAVGFFGLALVGWWAGVPPLPCALRAVAGAVVLYAAAIVVGKVILKIVVTWS